DLPLVFVEVWGGTIVIGTACATMSDD
ncbi:hypothetical protein A2U01_0115681, partial [Trifolium medium]|nr:hypothetical protein [Trifolium medium]